ncbi:hypothetical protein H1R16_00735 [Marnyiella aurantia]|uniref:GLPGLI family protein n=1 Tax=Marnyiella aurantia TaxID=2758037 RepID=A0A7D7LTX5_9FLAO|nr:hypothetical protein [Marnyiella aurantia]MBA5246036.1 hypothetical protein [Marnyiella aurantia]QMS98573.1 hypothetical protein H1R16_00735 [Marnyiella aurantia]
MRKTVLLLTTLFSISAFAQIKVLKNDNLIEVGKENSVALYKKQNKYTFNYQDINTSNLNTFRSFYFHDLNKDFEQLYKLVSDGFIDMPMGEIQLELPNDIIGLNFARNYGQTTVQFIHYISKSKKYIGKSQFLTKSQVDKVFGKDKIKATARRESTATIKPLSGSAETTANTAAAKKKK